MKTELLQKQWMDITAKYKADENLRRVIFNELITHYNDPGRFYHNLTHIETMLKDLEDYYSGNLPDELFFAAWFHDAIYNAMLPNNEGKSAELAVKELKKLQAPKELIAYVESLILETANHLEVETDNEMTMVFLDADLKILGTEEPAYLLYTEAVRKEYAMFPDLLFNRGRKAFLKNALATLRIYRTDKFFKTYEQQARKNLQNELNQML